LIRLALYQPEIPQNTGTLLRMGACLGVGIDIIEPCGFALSDARLKRAGMDYLKHVIYDRFSQFDQFLHEQNQQSRRVILLTPKAPTIYIRFQFRPDDTLLLGRESDGVPESVEDKLDYHIKIPLVAHQRSLNIAIAASMVLGEALRQTNLFPG
jgi:tRNA (cytidine/uridine-2'-O-)-methyltransferase